MSLEQALKENTAAVRDLIAAMQSTTSKNPAAEKHIAEKHVAENPVEKAVGVKKSTVATAAEPKQTQAATQPAVPSADTATPSPSELVTYEQVKKAFLALINAKSREKGVAVLTEFGAARLPEVKEAEFAAFFAACEKASS